MNLMNTTVPAKRPKQPVSNAVFYSVHVVLMVLFFGVGKLLTVYEKTAPSLGEFFYPATVVIGFFVEIVVLAGSFFIEQKNLKTCMETQKIPNRESNLEKEKRSWKN